jgi:hypothetical protein
LPENKSSVHLQSCKSRHQHQHQQQVVSTFDGLRPSSTHSVATFSSPGRAAILSVRV